MTDDLQLEAMTQGLVSHFRRVATTRMAGVPIINPALDVEAVGFARSADGCIGVLITPWFMSLVLLPCEGDDWQDRAIGSDVAHRFASGHYVFQVAGDDTIGRYQACSLMSPLLEIPDQATAVAVARAALDALHDETQRDTTSRTHAAEVARRWHGEPADQADEAGDTPPADVTLSRRAFICGGLLDEPDRDGGG